MKVKKVLNVSAEAFFKEITKSIIGDVKRQTGKNIHLSQLKPKLNYKKKLRSRSSMNSEVIVKILECHPFEVYSSSFTSKIDQTIVKYEIFKQGPEQILVCYSEDYKLLVKQHMSLSLNHYLEKRSEKRAIKLLKQIEETIQHDKQENK